MTVDTTTRKGSTTSKEFYSDSRRSPCELIPLCEGNNSNVIINTSPTPNPPHRSPSYQEASCQAGGILSKRNSERNGRSKNSSTLLTADIEAPLLQAKQQQLHQKQLEEKQLADSCVRLTENDSLIQRDNCVKTLNGDHIHTKPMKVEAKPNGNVSSCHHVHIEVGSREPNNPGHNSSIRMTDMLVWPA